MTRLTWSNDEPIGLQPTVDQSPSRMRDSPDLLGLGRRALRAGQQAPRFRLPDQHGRMVRLTSLMAQGVVVLRFCRNEGISSCFSELDALVAVHVDIQHQGATLVVIAAPSLYPHPADKDPATSPFTVLTDKRARVARSYGLTFSLPPRQHPPAEAEDINDSLKQGRAIGSAPATYVIDEGGLVALAFIDLEARSRMDPDDVVVALKCLGKKKTALIYGHLT